MKLTLFILFILLILIICLIIVQGVKLQCVQENKYGGSNSNKHRDHSNSDSKFTSDLRGLSPKPFEKGFTQNSPPLTPSDLLPTSTSDLLPTSMAMTYTISGEDNGLDFSQLRQILKESGNLISWVEKPVTEIVHVSFGTFKNNSVVKGEIKRWNYDPLFFKQKAAIKNTLGEHHNLINKSELYDTIKNLIPNGVKFLPKSYTIAQFEQIYFSKGLGENPLINYPLIVKKDKIPQQQGIRIVMSDAEYHKAIKDLHIKNDAVISEYIANPLLLDGKKMHLRVYYLLSIVSGITRCTVHDEYRIHLAEKEYKKEDWLNPDIHVSGAISRTKNRRYQWPDDVSAQYDINLINKKMEEFNKVICMAFTLANAKHYSESYAGYHLYGADVLITDEFKVYLLEINDRPGFRFSKDEKNWEEVCKKFSYKLFSFILHSTVFPFLGITRPPIYEGEFIGNGALTQFAGLLTGPNKYFLLPYLNATQEELSMAKNISFIKNTLSFEHVIKDANLIDIFLIGSQSEALGFWVKPTFLEKSLQKASGFKRIIGYLALDKQNYLHIAIAKEYQNRGIATAIIAQLIEIYFARHIANKHFIIYIKSSSNAFMDKIANKLQFTINKNIYEKDCKIHNNVLINKILEHKLLTYKIINDSDYKIDFQLSNFTKSNSQFVHFIYILLEKNPLNTKYSTGSKYNSSFIYQGAELKSALDIKILFGAYIFKKWYYASNIVEANIVEANIAEANIVEANNIEHIFGNKRITLSDKFDNDKIYGLYDYTTNKKHIINKFPSELSSEHLIEEWHMPYLIDDKLVCVRYYTAIYYCNNVIKIYCFNKHFSFLANEKWSMHDLNNDNRIKTFVKNPIDITLDCSNIVKDLLIPFFKMLLQYNIKPYPESNSGFYELYIDIKFIKKTTPVIHQFYNWAPYSINEKYLDEYYQWLNNCIISQHFGMQLHNQIIKPICGCVNNPKIKYSIIEHILLEFNKERTNAKIYYEQKLIGHIKLDIQHEIIELTHIEIEKQYRNKNISIHIIFILMNILSAYYSPIAIVLSFKYIKQMHNIAFELEFTKKENMYIKNIYI